MKAFLNCSLVILSLAVLPASLSAMISVGNLSPEQAQELGITMKHRPNGDAGTMVWIEFKKEGFLEKLTYTELRMTDADGNHLVSARLQPNPVVHDQSKELFSVSFSADPAHLNQCAFLIVAYGSIRGDVGYYLHVKDFIDLTAQP